ncbi:MULTISPECIES: hypothetical protein [Paraburkholderia]|uniref:Apea-like HEPN domain-containing protein n=1 Tax=Paraburkholderia nemoris TaxID=2793076 RepID=A0ABN7N8T4_9BURK|nr:MULTISPECIES: hypothetical protein [Paraburkholderia]MBK5184374.1 hypothetical protein [Burkholderia sp. R-69749]MBK3816460.1 hypothetical protein [Paraburkholderia aspalathi]CAE6858173.1 hypothetical protein R75777_07901 [Paraburkholderia nemoris]CAE6862505.1 hypothetical protein R69776_08084 [Paraburkholderia nemoris]CAE6872310.1 hypothetical protein R69749_06314 [Paraburkholderia domus]
MEADQEFLDALATLWRIPPPGPDNLLSAPAFVALSELCDRRYGGGKATFALSNALRSLGLPCELPPNKSELALDLPTAAATLVAAYSRKMTVRRYLCPLDLADELPPMTFGNARVAQFTAEELEKLFDAPRLGRNFPTLPLESKRLAQFQWLVVEEEFPIDPRPEARAVPILFADMQRDFGEIDPHLGRFPPAVEGALFFLLLARWEEWSTMKDVDWRGFRMPWIYTLDEDLFVRLARPPSPDSLSLEPWIIHDGWGEEIELERPTSLPLDDGVKTELPRFNASAWAELQAALTTSLFETPVVHFLVRAFLADGIDEVIAHMTAIEASLGLELDHKGKRPKTDPHWKLSATKRVAARMGAALADAKAVQDYKDLFELRSAFIHGRAGLQKISTPQRVLARGLARRVACALISLAAAHPASSRADILASLLDQGTVYL